MVRFAEGRYAAAGASFGAVQSRLKGSVGSLGLPDTVRDKFLRIYFFALFPTLFLQAAVVNIDAMPEHWISRLKSIDEAVVMGFVIAVALFSRYRPGTFHKKLRLVIAVFLGISALSAFSNNVPWSPATTSLFLFVKGYLLYFAVSRITATERQSELFVYFVAGTLLVCTAIAFLQVAGVNLPWHLDYRLHLGVQSATSIFNHHTRWATASSLGVAVAMALVICSPRERRWQILLVVLAIGMLMSTSRRHLVSMPLAFFVCSWVMLPTVAMRVRRFVTYGAVAALVVVMLIPVLAAFARGTYQEYVVHARSRDRYVLYKSGFELAVDSPVLGRGPGTFGSWPSVTSDSPVYWELGIERLVPTQYKNGAPYASYLGEGGFLGLVFVLGIFSLMGRRLAFLAERMTSKPDRILTGATLIIFANGLLETIVHPFFTGSIATYVFFGAFGLTEARYRTQTLARVVRDLETRRYREHGRHPSDRGHANVSPTGVAANVA